MQIVSTIPDKIRLDIDIINIRFEYLYTDTVSDIKYPDSNTDIFEPFKINSVSNTIRKYLYHFHP
jgi:hypothetical protein